MVLLLLVKPEKLSSWVIFPNFLLPCDDDRSSNSLFEVLFLNVGKLIESFLFSFHFSANCFLRGRLWVGSWKVKYWFLRFCNFDWLVLEMKYSCLMSFHSNYLLEMSFWYLCHGESFHWCEENVQDGQWSHEGEGVVHVILDLKLN